MDVSDDKEEVDRSVVLVNVCRCCLNDGCYKDISTEYHWIGQTEIYEDMLKDTFDICISYHNGGGPSSGSRLICEDCISKLRDASEFKKKVLESENNFTNHLKALKKRNAIKNALELKEEEINNRVKEEYEENTHKTDDDHHDYDCGDNADFDDSEIIADIKLENNDDDSDFELTLESLRTKFKTKRKKSSKIKTKTRKKAKLEGEAELIETSTKKNNKVEDKGNKDWKKIVERRGNGPVLRENSLKLLANSTICVFQWNKSRYRCFCCQKPFPDMTTLRHHTNNSHTLKNIEKIIILQQNKLVKVEVSSILCKLCSEPADNLLQLKKHLIEMHSLDFGLTTDDLLVPFKLDTDNLQCQLCYESFRLFRLLNIHMNKHYQKQVCHICGAGFSNLVFLNLHKSRSHRPHFCKQCGVEFSSRLEKRDHDVSMHNLRIERKLRFPCPYCKERFLHENVRVEHLVDRHGLTRPEHKCTMCSKIYITKSLCNTHIKNVHLKEKNHECNLCNMRFYTKSDANRHKVTHTGEKNFSCTFCNNLFATKDSLRRHIKRTHVNL